MTKTLIIPGLDGSPAPHWQAWWAATDPQAHLVDLPSPTAPIATLWETELAGMILRHPDSILVGHSLGAVLVVRLLNKWPQLRVRAALLVAPAEPSRDHRIANFGALPLARLDIPVTLAASRNDPWMSYAQSSELAQSLNAELIDMGHSGHINAAAGFGPWPQAKLLRNALLHRSLDHRAPIQPHENQRLFA